MGRDRSGKVYLAFIPALQKVVDTKLTPGQSIPGVSKNSEKVT